ncbi:MAG: sulfatase [Planctomycetaceae bacterium]|nr:sulfatase [Planctomycetaceae bacterium]
MRAHVSFFVVGLALVVLCAETVIAAERPPNIVLIVADDLGYGDLACYGSMTNKTPHIDALAASGLRFVDFHSGGPMCSPTRAAMLTGQYQQRFGTRFDGPLSEERDWDHGLPHTAVTIAEVFRSAGYATACFGKWHLGYHPPFLPPDQGFDEFRGLTSGDGDYHTQISRAGRADWWHNNEHEATSGYTTDLLTRYSIEFIEQHRERPFLLYVPHLAIHFPWQGPDDPPQRQLGTDYADEKWGIIPDRNNVQPHVQAMVAALDASVGEIVASLKRLGLEQNTVLVFTSDNGGYLHYDHKFHNISSNGPLRGQKGTIYEGGHRVPAIVVWPGKIEPGETAEIAHSTDLLPTFARIAGIDTAGLTLDGFDISPLLLQGRPLPERRLFWRSEARRAVRSGPWKLCVAGGAPELYNLQDDLAEQHDLAAEQPERVQELLSAWHAWEADVNRSAAELQ